MAAKFVVASLAFVACTLADPGYYGYAPFRSYYGYGNGVARHYGGGSSYVGRTIWGLQKRDAEAEPEADADADAEADADAGFYGYAGHPFGHGYGYGYPYGGYGGYYGYGARSYEYRSPQGLRGKRDADAEPGFYGGYGYGGYHGPYGAGYYRGYGPGVAAHYGGGSSYTYRSPQGLSVRGKRSAEPFGYGYGYGYGHPYAGHGRSFQEVIRPYANSAYSVVNGAHVYEDNYNGFNGRYRRSAEPFGYGYGVGSFQSVHRPGSHYYVNDRVHSAHVGERTSTYGAHYGYGFNSGYYY